MKKRTWDLDDWLEERRFSIPMDANTGGIDVLPFTPENSPSEICAATGDGSVAAIGAAIPPLRDWSRESRGI